MIAPVNLPWAESHGFSPKSALASHGRSLPQTQAATRSQCCSGILKSQKDEQRSRTMDTLNAREFDI
jgi:hypothetical protein